MGSRKFAPLAAAALLWLPAACAPTVQPLVAQFGGAVTTTAAAENAMFDAIDARKADARTLCTLASRSIDIGVDGQITPRDVACQVGPATVLPPDVRRAIEEVLGVLAAYGQSLGALAGSTAATTFDTNLDALGRGAVAFDAKVLAPLGGPGGLSQAQVDAVGTAVKDVANAIIAARIARDVQAAARQVQGPLATIAATLKRVNGFWTAQLPANQSALVRNFVIVLWPKADLADRQALMAAWAKAAPPLTSAAADRALDNMVAANDRIATAGPVASMAEIDAAIAAAKDAFAAYKALAGK